MSTSVEVALPVLSLLADPQRVAIVRELAREQQCTCHLVERLGLSQPAVSYHLGLLREAGIVDGERRGRFTFYRLHPEPLRALAAELDGLAAEATAQRTAPACTP